MHAGAVEGWVYLGWFDQTSLPNLPSAQVAMGAQQQPTGCKPNKMPIQVGMIDERFSRGAVGGRFGWLLCLELDPQGGKPSTGLLDGEWNNLCEEGRRSAGKLAVGLQSACACWPSSAPHPAAFYNASSEMYANGAGPQSWAILGSLALRIASRPRQSPCWKVWFKAMGAGNGSLALAATPIQPPWWCRRSWRRAKTPALR